MTRRLALASLVVVLLATLTTSPDAQTKLLRFPDIHNDKVVFCYAGDLWIASANGGTATQLTTDEGQEVFPKFSPDGKWIAFTGQYDGDEQVYVIPAAGGAPKQLTYYPARGELSPRWGFDNQIYGWTLDGSAVLFRSMRYGWDLTDTQLFTVPVTGGLPEPLPMPVSGAGDYSPDGKKMVYSPLVRDFRTWKRYQGGWSQDLYIFDLKSFEVEQVTDDRRSDRDPMWIKDRIYFTSDRDGTLNLYAYETGSKQTTQLTNSKTIDVRWPSADAMGNIVYEFGGELRVRDTNSGQTRDLAITVPSDGLARRPHRVAASQYIEHRNLSPTGKRAVFAARGDIFTVPVEHGPTRNLTNTSDAHEKWPSWSPDGSQICFISDASGEEELYLIAQDGKGETVQLTNDGKEMRYGSLWSPDGSHIAFSDKNGRLYLLEVKSKKKWQIADEKSNFVSSASWSPNGGYIAYTLDDPSGFPSIYIYSLAENKSRRITGELFGEFGPVFSPDGDYLFYLSDRMFQPQIGSFEWNYVVDRESGIYALALRKDVKNLFAPRSDEEEVKSKENDDQDKKDKDDKKDDDKAPIKIDWDGLADRVIRVPVTDDNYYGLDVVDGKLLYVKGGPFYYGRGSDVTNEIMVYDLKERKAEVVAESWSYALSHDGKKIIYSASGGYKVGEPKKGAGDAKQLNLSDMYSDRVPEQEFVQIFDEVWRRYRDFFYVENMHGNDWDAIGKQYRALLPHVGHRADLNYVIGEMIGELSVSHAYKSGGQYERPSRPRAALPGARIALDKKAGRYQITKILRGQNEETRYRSPLTEVGVNASQGDYILAIDGEPLTADMNPYQVLQHKTDPVTLTVNSKPTTKGAREVTYDPIGQERNLVYLDWITRNREYVAQKTDGRVGYIHVPDMGSNGIREFIKYFYTQIRKEGLVIDVRGNGGGNVSQMLIERLRREMLSMGYSRNDEYPDPYPSATFHGHLVCLLNETSASDGDIFPAMFREAGLGPLIGKRSWGGVIGISGRGMLLDGASVSVPEYGFLDKDGNWVIENEGVDPDIWVENDPKSVIAGKDNQLDRGIAEIMKLIKENPKKYPKEPKPPVRNKTTMQ